MRTSPIGHHPRVSHADDAADISRRCLMRMEPTDRLAHLHPPCVHRGLPPGRYPRDRAAAGHVHERGTCVGSLTNLISIVDADEDLANLLDENERERA
jgi:hypothetical protein